MLWRYKLCMLSRWWLGVCVLSEAKKSANFSSCVCVCVFSVLKGFRDVASRLKGSSFGVKSLQRFVWPTGSDFSVQFNPFFSPSLVSPIAVPVSNRVQLRKTQGHPGSYISWHTVYRPQFWQNNNSVPSSSSDHETETEITEQGRSF